MKKKLTIIHHILRCRPSIQQDLHAEPLSSIYFNLSQANLTLNRRKLDSLQSEGLVSRKMLTCTSWIQHGFLSQAQVKMDFIIHLEVQVFHPAIKTLIMQDLYPAFISIFYKPILRLTDKSLKWRSCNQENLNVHSLDPAWVSKPSSGQEGLHWTSWGAALLSSKT